MRGRRASIFQTILHGINIICEDLLNILALMDTDPASHAQVLIDDRFVLCIETEYLITSTDPGAEIVTFLPAFSGLAPVIFQGGYPHVILWPMYSDL